MAFESALELPEAFKSTRNHAAESEGWQLQIQITVLPRGGDSGYGIYDQAEPVLFIQIALHHIQRIQISSTDLIQHIPVMGEFKRGDRVICTQISLQASSVKKRRWFIIPKNSPINSLRFQRRRRERHPQYKYSSCAEKTLIIIPKDIKCFYNKVLPSILSRSDLSAPLCH